MPHPIWASRLTAAGLPANDETLSRLDRYLDLLAEWNSKLNLTRITDRADAEIRHIGEALTLLPFLPPPSPSPGARRPTLADVGTGGGVPGVPLAICRPDLDVTLIDSTRKKLDAVDAIIGSLGLTNVTCQHARVESLTSPYDVVVARAVADLATLAVWCRRIVAPRGRLLAMKGPRVHEEIAALNARTRRAWAVTLHDLSAGGPEVRFVVELTRRGAPA